ncbi:MAG: nuclease-related domain-containing protein [Nitrososphaerota archaeon]
MSKEVVGRILMAILVVTRDNNVPDLKTVAQRCGVDPDLAAQVIEMYWRAEPSSRVLTAIKALEHGCDPSSVARLLSWGEMESFTMEAGRRTGYRVFGNIHFREGRKRYQVDLILWRDSVCLIVDCKRWAKPLTGKTLLDVAGRQEVRTKALAEHLNKVAPGGLEVFLYPVVVTVYEPMSRIVGTTCVVPVHTLVSFLNTVDSGHVSRLYRASISERWSDALLRPHR